MAWISRHLVRIAGEAANGMYYTTVAGPVSYYPEAAKFAADYKAGFGKDADPLPRSPTTAPP